MYEVYEQTHIDSAHFLKDYDGKCQRCHGHRWIIRVYYKKSELDKIGMVVDFSLIKQWLEKEIRGPLDHRIINEVLKIDNPTAEILSKRIFDKLRSYNFGEYLSRVRVYEDPDSCCEYTSDDVKKVEEKNG